jgi:NhaP-type Na+/H+ or K+/H+ antiporter
MMVTLITIAVILLVYAAVSKPLDARGVTSAMVFTAAGVAVGTSALDLVDLHLESLVAERFCELALVFLLFSDSTRIDLGSLRRQLSWPSRLLLIGLPLTILAGLGAGLLVLPGVTLAGAFVLSAMVCSTDAALGQRVVTDASVPARVRQALDVESGLNDGLAVPFFLVAVDLSLAQLTTGVSPLQSCVAWRSRSAGACSPVSAPGRWRVRCFAWPPSAGGSRGNGGRSSLSLVHFWPTWSPCAWAAAGSWRRSWGG